MTHQRTEKLKWFNLYSGQFIRGGWWQNLHQLQFVMNSVGLADNCRKTICDGVWYKHIVWRLILIIPI